MVPNLQEVQEGWCRYTEFQVEQSNSSIDEYLDKGEAGLPVRLPDEPLELVEACQEFFDQVMSDYLKKSPNYEEELRRAWDCWYTVGAQKPSAEPSASDKEPSTNLVADEPVSANGTMIQPLVHCPVVSAEYAGLETVNPSHLSALFDPIPQSSGSAPMNISSSEAEYQPVPDLFFHLSFNFSNAIFEITWIVRCILVKQLVLPF